MFGAPDFPIQVSDLVDDSDQSLAVLGQRILGSGRNFGINMFGEQTVEGQFAEPLGQDLGRNTLDMALQGARSGNARSNGL